MNRFGFPGRESTGRYIKVDAFGTIGALVFAVPLVILTGGRVHQTTPSVQNDVAVLFGRTRHVRRKPVVDLVIVRYKDVRCLFFYYLCNRLPGSTLDLTANAIAMGKHAER